MSVQPVSMNRINLSATQPSTWKGRGVVVVDPTYRGKQAVNAGDGRCDSLGRCLLTAALVFAAVIASVAVGIATGSLQSALITLAVVGVGTVLTNMLLLATNSRL